MEAQRENWFSDMFHALQTDKLLLETNTASEEKRALYAAMMGDDIITASILAKESFNRVLTKKALFGFVVHLANSGCKPAKLAFNIADSSLLVWAVVADDDFATEKAIYLAQSAVNTDLIKADYRISATVVDESDDLPIPAHYKEAVIEHKTAR